MASKGQDQLESLLKQLLPHDLFVYEYHIGDKLRLDLYLPGHKVAVEYHGRQHFEYVEHFHGNLEGFHESLARDQRKLELCKEHGIVLIVFDYKDKLDIGTVSKRVFDVITNTDVIAPPKPEKSEYHKQQLAKAREASRANYRRMKELKKRNDGR